MKLSMAGVFSIILIMSGCADPKPQAELLRTVMVSQVQAYDGQQSHVLSGVVQAAETSQLSFEVAGVVENVNVNLGDTIARGDKLARIESKVFELAVKQRQGQLSEIQARIKDAQKDVNRKKQLVETGAVSQAEYDVAVTQLNALSDQAEVAEAQLSIAEEDLADTTLVAPYAGTIAQRHIEPSQRVTPAQPAFTVEGTAGLEVALSVPESMINYLNVQDVVKVTVYALGETNLKGRIFEVSSRAGSANAFPVTVQLDDAPKGLQPGMSAEVTLSYTGKTNNNRESRGGFIVPLSALGNGSNDSYFVYTATPIEHESGDKSPVYRVTKVPVTLLNMNKDTALIEGEFDGLPSVVRAGVAHLSADQRVHVANGDTHFFNE